MRYYLGLGTNLGDREKNLKQCRIGLQELGIVIAALSSIYETQPVGIKNQPWFLNQVIAIDTDLLPKELLTSIKSLEEKMGRVDDIKYGPRLIDIDILLADDLVLDKETLQIPHPDLVMRNFVLIPLEEIAPEVIHPIFKKTIRELARESRDTSLVKEFELSS